MWRDCRRCRMVRWSCSVWLCVVLRSSDGRFGRKLAPWLMFAWLKSGRVIFRFMGWILCFNEIFYVWENRVRNPFWKAQTCCSVMNRRWQSFLCFHYFPFAVIVWIRNIYSFIYRLILFMLKWLKKAYTLYVIYNMKFWLNRTKLLWVFIAESPILNYDDFI